jgi:hypothetical protein
MEGVASQVATQSSQRLSHAHPSGLVSRTAPGVPTRSTFAIARDITVTLEIILATRL